MPPWVEGLSDYIESDQPNGEDYAWLGQTPSLGEWKGSRKSRELTEYDYTIKNVPFQSSIDVKRIEMEYDKTSQVLSRVRNLAQKTNQHWAILLSDLIEKGESEKCYDGSHFFSDTHQDKQKDSPLQDNLLDFNAAAPSKLTSSEAEAVILESIEKMMGFKDDVGEPMNEDANSFRIMVPLNQMTPFSQAIGNPIIVDGGTSRTNTIANVQGAIGDLTFSLSPTVRLSATSEVYTFREDSITKAFIRQELDEGVRLTAKGAGSEYEHDTDMHQYGVSVRRNVGYGYWQYAVKTKFT